MNHLTGKELALRIRYHAINMTHNAGASHIASVLSIADIVGMLYAEIMMSFPNDPENDQRDRFILSKGHAGVAIYAALAEIGFFPLGELEKYYLNGSFLSGHISHKNVNGVEFSTGSLGHGVCVASGMALSAKLDKKNHHIYSIIGDGECNEGSVWEMAMFARQNKLDNFTVIIDHNKLQATDTCKKTMDPIDLGKKWEAFGWNVIEIDGHNFSEIKSGLKRTEKEKPACIIAHTTKGKGISFMENNILWHYRDPQGDFYKKALMELGEIK